MRIGKKKVVSLYLGANEGKRWTIGDVDKLIRERARMGIYTMEILGHTTTHFTQLACS